MSGGVARAFWNLVGPTSGALPHVLVLICSRPFSIMVPSRVPRLTHTVYHTVQVILARPKAAAVWVGLLGRG